MPDGLLKSMPIQPVQPKRPAFLPMMAVPFGRYLIFSGRSTTEIECNKFTIITF